MATDDRPAKPSKDFPLFAHSNGQWAKKIAGKMRYFGKWEDHKGALDRYLDERHELKAGRIPKSRESNSDKCEMEYLVNHFLTSKKRKLGRNEITERTYGDYLTACRRILDFFGRARDASGLGAEDFRAFRDSFPDGWGLATQSDQIQRTRTVFNHGKENGLIKEVPRYGSDFQKPTSSSKRIQRQKQVAERGLLLFSASEIQQMLIRANPVLKACIYLGINCGFGNTDCAKLTKKVVDLQRGWITFPRPKTGADRRAKLWPETITALREAIQMRPEPFEESDAELCFLTSRGRPMVWHSLKDGKHSQTNNLTSSFSDLLENAKIQKSGRNFYTLRRSFETIAGGTKDQVAVNLVMGHIDSSMAAVYRQSIEDERLEAISAHVREWLMAEKRS